MSYRKINGINMELFKEDLRLSKLCQQPLEELDDLTHSYNTTLKRILDRHEPLRVRSVVARPRVPWFTNGIREAKRELRKTERRWRTTNLDVYFQRFKRAKNRANYLMNRPRSELYSNLISEHSGNRRKLFSIKRVCKELPDLKVRKLLYCALVLPKLEYASCLWSPYTVKYRSLIENVQLRATKFILNYPPDMSYTQRLARINLLPLEFRREISDLMLLFKSRAGLIFTDVNDFLCTSSQNIDLGIMILTTTI
jgi:hypothetical protein